MIRRIAILAALLFSISPVLADGEIRVRAFIEPEGDIFVGQQVRLNVEVQTDTWFTSAPSYPELELPGTIALMPDAFGINSTTREGGKTWAGQTRRFVLFPERSGVLNIPPIEIALAVAKDGRAGPPAAVLSPAVVIPVLAPPGSDRVGEFVTTPSYRIDYDWDSSLDDLKVGDAISLTVTQSAADVFALTIPAVAFSEIEGMALYPAEPELNDRNRRGKYSGSRTDRVTYVLQEEGEFTIPAVTTAWFDLGSKSMKTASTGETTISVAANPAALLGLGEQADEGETIGAFVRIILDWLAANIRSLTAGVGVLYILVRLTKSMLLPAISRWQKSRRAWRNSEEAFFRALQLAARSGNPDRFVADFWRWSDRLPGRTAPLSLDSLYSHSPDPSFDKDWATLDDARYLRADEGNQESAIRRLRKALARLRNNWLTNRIGSDSERQHAISEHRLNP